MSLKWKEIAQLAAEAEGLLVGASVQKISQLNDMADSFVLHGFGERGYWRLWINLTQDQACWVLAGDDWEMDSQPEPTTFVMVLRKRLLGRRVLGIEQVPGERILLMHFEDCSLLCELLPKRANLLLVDGWQPEERRARCVHSFRQVSLEAGALYRLPPAPPTTNDEMRDFGDSSGPGDGPYPYHQRVAEHYWQGAQRKGFTGYQRLWRQAWKSHGKKVATALKNSIADLEEAREAELFQKRGMALVTHLYALGPQAYPKTKSVELDGLEIPLDPTKTFSDNAEGCFKKAKKFHRAVAELEARVTELNRKIEEIQAVGAQIESAADEAALELSGAAFAREGLEIPERPTSVEEKKATEAKPFLEVQSSDGFAIYCGRNQEENRRVTFREGKGNDLWLHVKGLPGAHVVIKQQKNKTVPLSTLLEAAQLCLYYSKIRKGKRAEVDYTARKHVRAIKGTLAEVTYTGNKTLYVEADPEALKRLLK